MKDKLLIISIFTLAISIIFGSIWIGNSLVQASKIQGSEAQLIDKALLTEEECAKYLNISIEDLNKLIREHDYEKSQLNSYSPFNYISYIEINNKKMFSKEGIDKWVNYRTYGIE